MKKSILLILFVLLNIFLKAEFHWHSLYEDNDLQRGTFQRPLNFSDQENRKLYKFNLNSMAQFLKDTVNKRDIVTESLSTKHISLAKGLISWKENESSNGRDTWKYRRELSALYEWMKTLDLFQSNLQFWSSNFVLGNARTKVSELIAGGRMKKELFSGVLENVMESLGKYRPYCILKLNETVGVASNTNYHYYVYFYPDTPDGSCMKTVFDGITWSEHIGIEELYYLFGNLLTDDKR